MRAIRSRLAHSVGRCACGLAHVRPRGLAVPAGEWKPGSESWRAGHPPPRNLTVILSRAPSCTELLRTSAEHGEAFNAVHCSALWVRLGRLARDSADERAWLRANPSATAFISERTLRLIATFSPREISNTAYGAAWCGPSSPLTGAFWPRLASAALPQMRDFKSSELKLMAWAYAFARTPSPRLFDALGQEALARATAF